MVERLLVCPDCRRHVRAGARACPFCRTALDASSPPRARATGATIAAALVSVAAGACTGEASPRPRALVPAAVDTTATPSTPPRVDPAAATPATPSINDAKGAAPDAGRRSVDEPSAVYGGPPPR